MTTEFAEPLLFPSPLAGEGADAKRRRVRGSSARVGYGALSFVMPGLVPSIHVL